MHTPTRILLATTFALAMGGRSLAQELVDLPVPGVNFINSRGQIACQLAGGHACLLDHGVVTDLGTLGGSYSWPTAINDAGQVVGNSTLPGDMYSRAFLYSDGVMTDLGTLGGFGSAAIDLNEAGEVTGTSWTVSGQEHAFRYRNGTMEDLGTLGWNSSEAVAINDHGDVAGTSGFSNVSQHAFLYSDGVMIDLGEPQPGWGSRAVALNNAGQVAFNSGFHAYLYDAGTVTDLGFLGGGARTQAVDMNEAGQVAGDAVTLSDGVHHFLYSDGEMLDLGKSFLFSSWVEAVNDFGQVLIEGMEEEFGRLHSYLWSDGELHEIAEYADASVSAAALNNAGQVIGYRRREFDSYSVAYVTWCPVALAKTCVVASRSSLRVVDAEEDDRNEIKWRWSGAGAVEKDDLGTPDAVTTYHACLYETQSSQWRLSTRLELGPNAAWDDRGGRGWGYFDKSAATNGIRKLSVQPGVAGKSRAQLLARGASIPMPVPYQFNPVALLGGRVAMSLHNDSSPVCSTASFPTPHVSDLEKYTAKVSQ